MTSRHAISNGIRCVPTNDLPPVWRCRVQSAACGLVPVVTHVGIGHRIQRQPCERHRTNQYPADHDRHVASPCLVDPYSLDREYQADRSMRPVIPNNDQLYQDNVSLHFQARGGSRNGEDNLMSLSELIGLPASVMPITG